MEQFDILVKAVKDRLAKLGECRHKKTSLPFAIASKTGSGTYVVCSHCGRRLPCEWTHLVNPERPL